MLQCNCIVYHISLAFIILQYAIVFTLKICKLHYMEQLSKWHCFVGVVDNFFLSALDIRYLGIEVTIFCAYLGRSENKSQFLD